MLTNTHTEMKKEECNRLQVRAYTMLEAVAYAIKGLTEEKPLILFDPKKITDDELHEFPSGYEVGRHNDYLEGHVMEVCGEQVTLFLTGDDYGKTIEIQLNQLPFGSQIDILSYIEKTLKY